MRTASFPWDVWLNLTLAAVIFKALKWLSATYVTKWKSGHLSHLGCILLIKDAEEEERMEIISGDLIVRNKAKMQSFAGCKDIQYGLSANDIQLEMFVYISCCNPVMIIRSYQGWLRESGTLIWIKRTDSRQGEVAAWCLSGGEAAFVPSVRCLIRVQWRESHA